LELTKKERNITIFVKVLKRTNSRRIFCWHYHPSRIRIVLVGNTFDRIHVIFDQSFWLFWPWASLWTFHRFPLLRHLYKLYICKFFK
jgi:hypothetical protein